MSVEQVKENLLLSVIIPSRNESFNLAKAVKSIAGALGRKSIPFEIVIVDDHSDDETKEVVLQMMKKDTGVRYVASNYPAGFGFAVRKGLDIYKGDAAVIVMADSSDSVVDLVRYYRKLQEGYDCVFGSRFCRKAKVKNYPPHKMFLNRLGNTFIQILFGLAYNDVTNAFKCFRREVIDGIMPLVSCHFNLTVEMPLKAIVRGYSWTVVPTNWYGRQKGISKWKIKELGSRYIFIILYVWLEKALTGGDYLKGKYWVKEKR